MYLALSLVSAAVLCYLIGSIPSGYLFVKLFHEKDITKEGSGNVGTLNTYKVSGSHVTTITVLIMDVLKGALPAYLLNYASGHNFMVVYTGCCFIIIGHNYPVWLKFKGGRGLASGAGIFAVINFGVLATWCVIWIIARFLKRGTLISNLIATAVFPFFVIIFRSFYIDTFSVLFSVYEHDYRYFIIFVFVISLLIIIKHRTVFVKKNNHAVS